MKTYEEILVESIRYLSKQNEKAKAELKDAKKNLEMAASEYSKKVRKDILEYRQREADKLQNLYNLLRQLE